MTLLVVLLAGSPTGFTMERKARGGENVLPLMLSLSHGVRLHGLDFWGGTILTLTVWSTSAAQGK